MVDEHFGTASEQNKKYLGVSRPDSDSLAVVGTGGPAGSAGIVAPDSTGKVPRARSSVVWHVSAGVAIQGSHLDSADAVPRYRHRAVLCELRGQEQSSGVSNRRCLSLGFEIPRSMFPDGSELVTMG